jgi:hypothetical protein
MFLLNCDFTGNAAVTDTCDELCHPGRELADKAEMYVTREHRFNLRL